METFSMSRAFVRESTNHCWIPLTMASDTELWCFLGSGPEQTVEQTIKVSMIGDAMVLIMMSLYCGKMSCISPYDVTRRHCPAVTVYVHIITKVDISFFLLFDVTIMKNKSSMMYACVPLDLISIVCMIYFWSILDITCLIFFRYSCHENILFCFIVIPEDHVFSSIPLNSLRLSDAYMHQ